MLLQRLDIRGFKSFEKKLSLSFDKGVTCVVGPNGCGKTNLLDAIRWVLGEQRARLLRSEKMENLIFNGSRTQRKPLHMAEVSLTFDNRSRTLATDFSSVQFTRRLYRSGESAYEINGVPSRLKDVADLLLDTGTTFNTYSIIELKMVDDIINDHLDARRVLFEESAGIARTKSRKKETFKKLHATEADLQRIDDLLHEVSTNLKHTEKEAEQARAYQGVKARHTRAHLEMEAFRMRTLTEKREELLREMDAENGEYVRCAAEKASCEARLQELRRQQDERSTSLKGQEGSLLLLGDKIRAGEHQKSVAWERLHALEERLSSLLSGADRQRAHEGEVQQKIVSLEEERQAIEGELCALEKQVSQAKEATDSAQKAYQALREIWAVQREKRASSAEHARALREHLSSQHLKKDALKARIAELERELRGATEKTKHVEEALALAKAARTEVDARHAQWDKERLALEALISRGEQELLRVRQAISEKQHELQACQSDHALQRSIAEDLVGFPEAVRLLRREPPWREEKPLLLEVMRCEPPYRLVLEHFFRPFWHYHVLHTMEEARTAFSFLEEKKVGRGFFFVCALLELWQPSSPPAGDETSLLPAERVVFCDPVYEKLKKFLLRGVYFHAKQPSFSFQSPPFLEGSFLFPDDGTILGGAAVVGGRGEERAHGVRLGGVRQRMRQLAVEMTTHKEALHALREESKRKMRAQEQRLEARTSISSRLARGDEERKNFDKKEANLRADVKEWQERRDGYKEHRASLLSHLDLLRADIRSLQGEVARADEVLSSLAAEPAEQESTLARLEEQHRLSLEQHQSLHASYHDKKLIRERLSQQISFHKERFAESQAAAVRRHDDLSQLREQAGKIKKEQALTGEKIIAWHREKKRVEERFRQAERAYLEDNHEQEQVEKSLQTIKKKEENLRFLVARLEDSAERNAMELEGLLERVQVSFQKNREELGAYLTDKAAADLEKDLLRAEKGLNAAGTANLSAIESHRQLKERYDFILSERGDLLQARKSLDETIAKIDRSLRKKFLAAFENIRARFRSIFCSIFSPRRFLRCDHL